MNTEIEHLADHKVRMTITIEEKEFEKSIDKAFKTLAKEVRLPGFRPGKAPRQILEKHIGYEAGRAQALNDYIPHYYIDAVDENDVDPVDYPELEVTAGEESGDVVFQAVVAVRPVVEVKGYEQLEVEVEVDPIDDEKKSQQLELLRDRHASLEDVDGAIEDSMFVTIDLAGSSDGEEIPGLSANEYLYEVGSGLIGAELDENLRGKTKGDTLEFSATLPETFGDNAGEEVDFKVEIKNVQTKNLPEVTDEWIKENTEFATLDEYQADTLKRLENIRAMQAQMQVQQKIMEALANLVEDEIPDAFVEREVDSRINAMANQSNATREQLDQYLEGLDQEARDEFMDSVKKDAVTAIKSDLAIRAIIQAENLAATDEDLEDEIKKYSEQSGEKINKIRNRIKKPGVEKQVRHDIAVSKAIKLVNESVVAKDSEGNIIEMPKDNPLAGLGSMSPSIEHNHDHDHDHDHDDHDHQH